MVKVNPALQLFIDRRFDEAVEAYRRQLREGPETEWPNLDGLGESLLASGRYEEAIPIFEKVSDYLSNSHPKALGKQQQLSVCHWMIGDREGALQIIRGLVVAVRDGKIAYADISGGVPYGLILCYMAITLGSKSDVDLAMKYLKKLTTRIWIKNWPGPVAQFLLGGLTFGDALKEATGSTDPAEAKKWAEKDSWGPRRLAPLLFAAGTERRMAGDEAGCRMFMIECASLRNPLVEYEWYLAKSELAS
jgi:tetratricopeptide (TPR) repeat protein